VVLSGSKGFQALPAKYIDQPAPIHRDGTKKKKKKTLRPFFSGAIAVTVCPTIAIFYMGVSSRYKGPNFHGGAAQGEQS
jgi:hypothetical protein